MRALRVIVVGGGISGLSAAYYILERARAESREVELTLLESSERVGGHVWTIEDRGFVVEAGPNALLDADPARRLVKDLGLESQQISPNAAASRRFVFHGRRLRRIPDSPPALLSSDALSLGGKLRVLLEPWARRAKSDAEESVFDFARRRLGTEAADLLADPVVGGISAGDSHALSVAAAFPRLLEMERAHGSLIRALMARRGAARARLMSFERGMGTLIQALKLRLDGSIRTRAPVSRVERSGHEWRVMLARGEELSADHVVLALPAWRAAPLLEAADPVLARTLDEIPTGGLAAIALAYRAADVPRSLDGYGFLTARREELATLGVTWESSIFERRAPEGHVLLRAMLGGARNPEIVECPENDLLARARTDLERTMGVVAPPSKAWVFHWPRAIAQYTRGHLERVTRARARAGELVGLELCGTSYDGVSINSAIASGQSVAQRVTAAWGDVAPSSDANARSTAALRSRSISEARGLASVDPRGSTAVESDGAGDKTTRASSR